MYSINNSLISDTYNARDNTPTAVLRPRQQRILACTNNVNWKLEIECIISKKKQ